MIWGEAARADISPNPLGAHPLECWRITFSLGEPCCDDVSAAQPRPISDSTSQNALSTFLGSFLFSLVGIVTLSIEGYGQRGRLILFLVTIAVIIIIVGTMLRWMEYLTRLGRVGETTLRVEEAAMRSVVARRKAPYLGGQPMQTARVPDRCTGLISDETGYVQHVDMGALQNFAEEIEGEVLLAVLPGTFVHRGMELAKVTKPHDEDQARGIRRAITIDDERTFEQDPRFGVLVLAEIGSRALSAAINDSGTAIDVIGRIVRVLLKWAEGPAEPENDAVQFDRIWVRPISED